MKPKYGKWWYSKTIDRERISCGEYNEGSAENQLALRMLLDTKWTLFFPIITWERNEHTLKSIRIEILRGQDRTRMIERKNRRKLQQQKKTLDNRKMREKHTQTVKKK